VVGIGAAAQAQKQAVGGFKGPPQRQRAERLRSHSRAAAPTSGPLAQALRATDHDGAVRSPNPSDGGPGRQVPLLTVLA